MPKPLSKTDHDDLSYQLIIDGHYQNIITLIIKTIISQYQAFKHNISLKLITIIPKLITLSQELIG